MQGDVTAIYDASGTCAATYIYDAWGKVLSVSNKTSANIGTLNPFRYRSYYYDVETGLYYLQTRYYDPEVGRFINSDSLSYLGDGAELSNYNLFAYCGNNPVMGYDPTGRAWWHWAIGAAIVVGCAVLTVATCGGSLAIAAASVTAVASGTAAAAGTAATVAAGMFIGSATVYGALALDALASSDSLDGFAEKGNLTTIAVTAVGAIIGGLTALSYITKSNRRDVKDSRGNNISGTASPKKIENPNDSYTQYDNKGRIYSYTQFDGNNNQTLRIDFQGRPHNGVIPHIHLFVYPQQGGKAEYVFDLNWHLID